MSEVKYTADERMADGGHPSPSLRQKSADQLEHARRKNQKAAVFTGLLKGEFGPR